jgi:hypothetical protein
MLGNLSEDIAQDDAFLDGGDLFGLALDSHFNPCEPS